MEPNLSAPTPSDPASGPPPFNVLDLNRPRRRRWQSHLGHGLRLLVLAGLILLIREEHRWQQAQRSGTGPERISVQQVRPFLPQATDLGAIQPATSSRLILDASDEPLGWLVQTAPASDTVIGYSGTTNCLLVFDNDSKLIGTRILSSGDTRDHVRDIEQSDWFLSQWKGLTWEEAASQDVDAVSGATLTSLAITDSIRKRLGGSQPNLRFPEPLQLDRIQQYFPTAHSVQAESPPGAFRVLDADGQRLGGLQRTSPASDHIMGYQGPTDLVLALDPQGTILGMWLHQSYDNQPYVGYVEDEAYFMERFTGKTLQEIADEAESHESVEGVSGATMTSQSIAAGVVAAAMQSVPVPSHTFQTWHISFRDLGTCWVLFAGMIFCFSRLRGRRAARIALQCFLVAYFGFLNGDLLSLALLAGWSENGITWNLAPGLALLGSAALVIPTVTQRQIYCHHICPFGAAQQLIKGRFGWKVHVSRRLHRLLKRLPAALLILALVSVMRSWSMNLASLEPFDAFVFWIAGPVSLGIAITGLIASGFIPMAYCRYGCPTGEILGLFRRTQRQRLWNAQDGLAILLLLIALMLRLSS